MSRRRHRWFPVAVLTAALAALAASGAAAAIGAYTTRGAWSFVSAPGLHPPQLRVTYGRGGRRAQPPGDYLVSNFPNLAMTGPMTGQGGPLILDRRLQPVWSLPVGTGNLAANLQQESYAGQPVLVWWQGLVSATGAATRGEVVVVDEHYRRIASITAKRPWVVSLHDAVISGDTIWVTVYRNVPGQDLRRYGGSRRGTVYDVGVQAYALRTGQLLYTWDALNPGHAAHVPLSESEEPPPRSGSTPWDAYHINSIQVLGSGQVLVSMRNTSGVYLLDTASGRILWTLGGKASSFRLRPGARFAWQHDAEMLTGNRITLFADNCCALLRTGRFAPPSGPSAGLVLRLDVAHHTASLVAAFRNSPPLYVAFLGSMQLLPGGGALVGWGSLPYFSEFSRTGRQLFQVTWPRKDQSYRALYTDSWVGTPDYPPVGAARRVGRTTTVYASWNGATQVARWQVLAGTSPQALSPAAIRPRSGFETAIKLGSGRYKAFAVRALDSAGRTLGTSPAFTSR